MAPARDTMPAASCLKALDLSHPARSAGHYDDGNADADAGSGIDDDG